MSPLSPKWPPETWSQKWIWQGQWSQPWTHAFPAKRLRPQSSTWECCCRTSPLEMEATPGKGWTFAATTIPNQIYNKYVWVFLKQVLKQHHPEHVISINEYHRKQTYPAQRRTCASGLQEWVLESSKIPVAHTISQDSSINRSGDSQARWAISLNVTPLQSGHTYIPSFPSKGSSGKASETRFPCLACRRE